MDKAWHKMSGEIAMTTKEYLKQAYRLDQKINSGIEEVARLREMVVSVTNSGFGEKVQTSRSTEASFVKSIEKIIALEERINEEIDLYVNLKTKIIEVIHGVEDVDCRSILEKRYLRYMSWENIAAEMAYSESWVLKLHRRALKAVEAILKEKGVSPE